MNINIECPICNDNMTLPKLYECGHSICELCMLKIDHETEKCATTNTIPLIRCPICRKTSLLTTEDRPYNLALIEVFEQDETYSDTKIEAENAVKKWVSENIDSEDDEDDNGYDDIATIAYKSRIKKTIKIQDMIVKSTIKYAKRGFKSVTISSNFKDVAEFYDEIKERLFERGVYAIKLIHRELVIHILPEDIDKKVGYLDINPDFSGEFPEVIF